MKIKVVDCYKFCIGLVIGPDGIRLFLGPKSVFISIGLEKE